MDTDLEPIDVVRVDAFEISCDDIFDILYASAPPQIAENKLIFSFSFNAVSIPVWSRNSCGYCRVLRHQDSTEMCCPQVTVNVME